MKDLMRIIRRLADDSQGVTAQRKNPEASLVRCRVFFFVAECVEISNRNLVDDIIKILQFLNSE